METLADKLNLIAADLRDFEPGHEFTQFAREQVLAWWTEGLCILHRLRPDLFTRSRTFTLAPGTRQVVEDCVLKSIDANLGPNGEEMQPINPASRNAQLAWGRPSCLTQPKVYRVIDYSLDPKQRDTFYVYPPTPPGKPPRTVRIVCVDPPITLGIGDLGVEAPVDCWQYAIVRHYVIAQAYQLDSDQANLSLSQSHFQTWNTLLGLTTRADQALLQATPSANVETGQQPVRAR